MDCSNCVTGHKLWAELTNGSSVCVDRLSSVGSRVVSVVSELTGCAPAVVNSTKNYGLEIGLPIGLLGLGIILFLIWYWSQRRGSPEYGGLIEEALNDEDVDVLPQQQQPVLPPLPTLTPAPGIIA